MHRVTLRLTAAVLLTASATTALARAAYQFTDIGGLFSTSSQATAINDFGQVVGNASFGGGQGGMVQGPWLWSVGTIVTLPTLSGNSAWANDINNAGDIVGAGSLGTATNAVIWRNKVATPLTSVGPWGSAVANSINNAGVVVGGYHARTDPVSLVRYQAAQWSPSGQITMLNSGYETSEASSVNSQGTVVGMVGNWPTSTHDPASALPSSWGPSLVTLQSEPRWEAIATDINDQGQIVGYNGNAYESPGNPFLWESGITTVLGDPKYSGRALALNEHTAIVGFTVVNGQDRATLWQGGSTIDLNTQVDPTFLAGGWVLSSATDINESGWIVGTATQVGTGLTRAFLLSPVPEPATGTLLWLGVLSLGIWSRHKARRCSDYCSPEENKRRAKLPRLTPPTH